MIDCCLTLSVSSIFQLQPWREQVSVTTMAGTSVSYNHGGNKFSYNHGGNKFSYNLGGNKFSYNHFEAIIFYP